LDSPRNRSPTLKLLHRQKLHQQKHQVTADSGCQLIPV
jgi:hypothetical protein